MLLELAEGRERERRWYGMCVCVCVCVRKRKKWAAGDKKVSTMPGRFCRGAADRCAGVWGAHAHCGDGESVAVLR